MLLLLSIIIILLLLLLLLLLLYFLNISSITWRTEIKELEKHGQM